MKEKTNGYNFIRNFGKISINKLCKENKIDIGNLYNNKCKTEKTNKIANELYSEAKKLIEENSNHIPFID